MKAYKLEVLVIDHEDIGKDNILCEFANFRHINPIVQSMSITDIGSWDDDHPLNQNLTCKEAYKGLDWKEVTLE